MKFKIKIKLKMDDLPPIGEKFRWKNSSEVYTVSGFSKDFSKILVNNSEKHLATSAYRRKTGYYKILTNEDENTL